MGQSATVMSTRLYLSLMKGNVAKKKASHRVYAIAKPIKLVQQHIRGSLANILSV